jgi:hypothetical protein
MLRRCPSPTVLSIIILLLSILNISFSKESQARQSGHCDKNTLKNVIEREYRSRKLSHKWKAVEGAITPDIKNCLLNRLYKQNSVQVVDSKTVIYEKIQYNLRSKGLFIAPASDHGYAIVFESDQSVTLGKQNKKVIKFAFSVYPSGYVNFINVFQLEIDDKNLVSFVEISPKGGKSTSNECIECHKKSGNQNLMFDNYKKIVN